jgi:methyltransferase
MKSVKEFDDRILTVMGGPHAILVPEDLADCYADVAVATEGEEAFRDLVEAFEHGRDLAAVPGLVLFRDGAVVRTERRLLIRDLSQLPLPLRSLTRRYRSQYFRGEWKPLAGSYTERGCAYHCTFCCTWLLGGASYRLRGVEATLRDLASIDEHYVFMAEDDSMFVPEYSSALCDAILASGIRKEYQFYGRSDHVVSHPQLYEKWKSAGLKQLLIGMEMTTDQDLAKVHKQNTIRHNEEAVKFLTSIGVEVISYFMVDPSTYTEKEFGDLRRYVTGLGLSHPIFFIMTPLPGTQLYRERYREIVADSYDLFDFYHLVIEARLPVPEFYRQFINLYRDCYSARSSGVEENSSFSPEVVARLVARLEQEYEPQLRAGAEVDGMAGGVIGPGRGSLPGKPLGRGPMRFKPAWRKWPARAHAGLGAMGDGSASESPVKLPGAGV